MTLRHGRLEICKQEKQSANMSNTLRVIESSPRTDDYTSLQQHQEQTPGTFFGGAPVLHHHVQNASLKVDDRELASNDALAALRTSAGPGAAPHTPANGEHDEPRVEVTITRIQIWVTSECVPVRLPCRTPSRLTGSRSFILWSTTAHKGVQIPYRAISLHARQQTALYMQLCLSDISQTADDDLVTVELLLQPEDPPNDSATDAAEQLYTAVSACADLHPDPDDDDDDQEPEPEPGAGGWITADNMHEFMDENGEFRMPEGGLGAGAGSVRTADQFDDADGGDEEVDGEGPSDETKWRRTS